MRWLEEAGETTCFSGESQRPAREVTPNSFPQGPGDGDRVLHAGSRWKKGPTLRTMIAKLLSFYDAQHIFDAAREKVLPGGE